MSRLTRDGTVETVSRDQVLRRERGQVNIHFPCSADHELDWQPYLVDPYTCYTLYMMAIHTYYLEKATFERVGIFQVYSKFVTYFFN